MKFSIKLLVFAAILSLTYSCKKEVDPNNNSGGGSYNSQAFDNVNVESNVVYGSSTTQGGVTENLIMDVYTPQGDNSSNRPLVILAHGGGFQGGDKEAMTDLATFFAKSGYVAVSLKYRIVDIPTTPFVMKKAVIDATHDMRAAVRFFRKDAQTTNNYRINPANIFAGGYSAGAFMGLHTAYMNSESEVMEIGGQALLDYVNSNGGLEGNSGNAGYSSSITGSISLAGALAKASFINAGEPVLYSMHGTADQVVPYMTGDSDGSGVITEGPGVYHPIADAHGITNRLYTVQNGEHDCFWSTSGSYEDLRAFIAANLVQ